MKQLICIALLCLVSLPGYSQLDFFFDKLSDIGGIFDAGEGYVSTINDVRQIRDALNLINESKCLIDAFDAGMDAYKSKYQSHCFDDVRFDMLRVRLDNSAILMADQLAGNAQGVANIFGNLLGGGDKAAKETAVAVNKSLVSDALNDAIASLFAIDIEIHRLREEINMLERKEAEMLGFVDIAGAMTLPGSHGVYEDRQENFSKMKTVGARAFKGFTNVVSVMINVIAMILLCAAGWLLVVKGDSVGPQVIIGILSAIVVLTVANMYI